MSLPKCKHGVSASDGRYNGTWNAPFSRCMCCGVMFPYIDSGSYGVEIHTRTWQPKDRCGACGGKYVEFRYSPPEKRRQSSLDAAAAITTTNPLESDEALSK